MQYDVISNISVIQLFQQFATDPIGVMRRYRPLRAGDRRVVTCRHSYASLTLVYDQELARELLVDQDFWHDPMVYDRLRPITGAAGLVQLRGEHHASLKDRLRPLLSPSGLKRLARIVDQELMAIFGEPTSQPYQLSGQTIYRLIWNIAVRYLFDSHNPHLSTLLDNDDLRAQFDHLNQLCGKRMRSPFNLPLWVPSQSHRQIRQARRAIVHRLTAAIRDADPKGVSMVSLLRDDHRLVDQLSTFLFAGHETTASGLVSALVLLARDSHYQDPRWLSVRGADRDRHLALFKEALRLHPPAYMLVRKVLTTKSVGGLRFRRGDHVVVALESMHRDPAYFDNPDGFQPERFLRSEPHPAFIPFGLGAKRCFGEPLSYFEATQILRFVLNRFHISSGADVSYLVGTTQQVHPNHILHLIPRSPSMEVAS